MIQIFKQNGNTSYGLKEYMIDTKAELSKIPTNIAMGSTVFVIEENKTYILNGNKEWIEKIGAAAGGVAQETDPTVPNWAKQPLPPIDLEYTDDSLNAQSGIAVKQGIGLALSNVIKSTPIYGSLDQLNTEFHNFQAFPYNDNAIRWVQWMYTVTNGEDIEGDLPFGHYLCAGIHHEEDIYDNEFKKDLKSFGIISCWNLHTQNFYIIKFLSEYIDSVNGWVPRKFLINNNNHSQIINCTNMKDIINSALNFNENTLYFMQFAGGINSSILPHGMGIGTKGKSGNQEILNFINLEKAREFTINLSTQEVVEKNGTIGFRLQQVEDQLNGLEALLVKI